MLVDTVILYYIVYYDFGKDYTFGYYKALKIPHCFLFFSILLILDLSMIKQLQITIS